jgi:hypothetical protein
MRREAQATVKHTYKYVSKLHLSATKTRNSPKGKTPLNVKKISTSEGYLLVLV